MQLIHTSGFLGTRSRTGDVDISVKYKSSLRFQANHLLGYQLQEMISTKSHILIAERNGTGSVIRLNDPNKFESFKSKIRDDQCVLGVENDENKRGKFRITITEKDL